MKERQLLKNIKQLKLKYFGHVVRHNNLEKFCLEGAVEGRRGRGRPRRRWTRDISDWLGFSVREASILAQDRAWFPLSCVGGYVLQGSAMKKRTIICNHLKTFLCPLSRLSLLTVSESYIYLPRL
ncbi:endonuclease-reverse transcriptase [Elysia marginata]|uniref:Endonuclease-reverse transcriptase n=1 Tax=Elysia marginata TaxID=1093978 RepID=A0AAV4GM22_9GAST|nr:endonuclease-reverse transcriptase [Elysia marginata]